MEEGWLGWGGGLDRVWGSYRRTVIYVIFKVFFILRVIVFFENSGVLGYKKVGKYIE